MKVIKNINNNVSMCLDNDGNQVIALGKGIGFIKAPCEVDMTRIERTFYDVDPIYLQTIQSIPEKILEVSAEIVDFARLKVEYLINSSIVFTLADHITFAIQRVEQNMNLEMPIYYDVRTLYEKECEIGEYALKLIHKKCDIALPKDEIIGIALHFINATAGNKKSGKVDYKDAIQHIKEIVEEHFSIDIPEDDFNYSRFVSHLQYLLKRGEEKTSLQTENNGLYVSVKEAYPDVYACACKITDYLKELYDYDYKEEESLYLMLHINRVYVREDCYQ